MSRNTQTGRTLMKQVLHLNLHRQWFDQVADKTKRTEYREITPYWRTRLEGHSYDLIEFRNGYMLPTRHVCASSFSVCAKCGVTVMEVRHPTRPHSQESALHLILD